MRAKKTALRGYAGIGHSQKPKGAGVWWVNGLKDQWARSLTFSYGKSLPGLAGMQMVYSCFSS